MKQVKEIKSSKSVFVSVHLLRDLVKKLKDEDEHSIVEIEIISNCIFTSSKYRIAQNKNRKDEKYKVVFDVGKSYEEIIHGSNNLKLALKNFYDRNKDNIDCDVKIYDENDNDITERQDIDEMVAEIINEE